MPFSRKGRPHLYVAPVLEPGRRMRPRSSGEPDTREGRRRARDMEAALRQLWRTGWRDLVERVERGELSLVTLWVAYQDRDQARALEALRHAADDPLLSSVVERVRGSVKDARTREGLDQLLELAPGSPRVSWLTDHKNIQSLIAKALEQGRKPNSVRRSLWQAIRVVLDAEYGIPRRQQILAGVKAPGGKDERRVDLGPDELRRLLDECERVDPELWRFVLTAILTAIDEGPLLRARVRHLIEDQGALFVPDTKTATRMRLLRLPEPALAVLRLAALGKDSGDYLFEFPQRRRSRGGDPDARRRWQLRKRWERARAAAGLPWLRVKDLRHVLPTYLAMLGCSMKQIQEIMGHADVKTTTRYITHQPVGDPEWMLRAAQAMGLDRPHVRGA